MKLKLVSMKIVARMIMQIRNYLVFLYLTQPIGSKLSYELNILINTILVVQDGPRGSGPPGLTPHSNPMNGIPTVLVV